MQWSQGISVNIVSEEHECIVIIAANQRVATVKSDINTRIMGSLDAMSTK